MSKTPSRPAVTTADVTTSCEQTRATARGMLASLQSMKKKVDAFHVAALDFVDAVEEFERQVKDLKRRSGRAK